MKSQLKKAVFPVAGFGTRFLPATKAMPKELLPIIDKPLIQYAAEEAINAGIETLIFVTGRNKRAIEDHFDSNYELETALRKRGKTVEADMVQNILPKHVECIFVRQPEQLGLGHAILCAQRAIGNEPFAVLLADDFIISPNFSSFSQLVSAFNATGKSQICVMEVDGPQLSNYGVVKLDQKGDKVVGLIEKPSLDNAPSNLASIGRYILTPEIFNILKTLSPGSGNEIQLADGLDILARRKKVEMQLLNGKRFDCGSVQGYLQAISDMQKSLGSLP